MAHLKSGFLAVGGVCLIATAAWFAAHAVGFLADAARTHGLVVRVDAKRGVRGGTLHYPVVRYRPELHADLVEFTEQVGLWPALFEPGDVVKVAYPPDESAHARVDSFWTLWFLPMVCAAMGGLCLFAGWHTHPQ